MPFSLVSRVVLVGVVGLGVGACASAAESRTDAAEVSSVVSEVLDPTTSESTTTSTTIPLVPLSPEVLLFGSMNRAKEEHVLGADGAVVVLSSCTGGSGVSHWGYYNNGAEGGEVHEPDGVVVPVGALCVNPAQPDIYSNLLHNLGLKYLWENGLWDSTKATFGGVHNAAECFAKVYGATVFGQGGCSDSDASRMRSLLGL
jgi:hypothetical protein